MHDEPAMIREMTTGEYFGEKALKGYAGIILLCADQLMPGHLSLERISYLIRG